MFVVAGISGGNSKKQATEPVTTVTTTATVARGSPAKRSRRGGRGTSATTTTSSSQYRQCGNITVNAFTSCPFARNVVKAYDASPSATVVAYSPVTKLTYALYCQRKAGVVACSSSTNSGVAFRGPAPTSGGTQSTAPAPRSTVQTDTAHAIEQPGSYSHDTDPEFCSTHSCIENFPNGSGSIIQCADGEWSHSGGASGACSDHGGER